MLIMPRLLAAAGLCAALASTAYAQTLQVGPGQSYATPCAAVAAAKPNDVIEIAAGTYTDSCSIGVAGVTLRGTGAQPKIDLSGTDHPAQYKGIYVVTAASVTIENLELTGANISDGNGANAAGIRVEAPDLTVRGCNIHDNQNGILGGTSGTITIEHSEFANNGKGDGCNQGGCTHNLYIANIDRLDFRFNWSHDVATDTPDKGHLLKSRAKVNYILYNRLSGQDGFDSYEVDLPNGGLAVLVGNVIEKGPHAGNSTLFSWGEEGASNPDKRVFLVSNTFVNDFGSGKFISASGATTTVHDNLFVGPGGGVNDADNLSDVDPLFVDRAGFDYHLQAGSPARGKGVDPGKADTFDLSAVSEYVHPLGETVRASHHDLGAFEYGTDTSQLPFGGAGAGGAGQAGGGGAGGNTQASSGGRSGAGNAGASAGGARAVAGASGSAGVAKGGTGGSSGDAGRTGGTGGKQGTSKSNGGCGCSVPRARESVGSAWLGLFFLAAGMRMRMRWRRASGRQLFTSARIRNGSTRGQP